MSTRTTGSVYGEREGCVEIVHTYPFGINTAGIADGIAVELITGSADNPTQIEVSLNVDSEFDGTGEQTIAVGYLGDPSAFLDITATGTIAGGYYPENNAVNKFSITSPTRVQIVYTDELSDASSGSGILIIKETVQSTLPIA